MVAVIVIGGIAYYLYKAGPNQAVPASSETTVTNQSQKSVTQNDPSQWQKYSYSDFSNIFSIQYPLGWKLVEIKPKTPTSDHTVIFKSPDSSTSTPILLSIETWQSVGPRSAAAQITQSSNITYDRPLKSTVNIGTILAVRFTDNSSMNGSWIIFEKKGYTYTVSARNIDEASFQKFYGSLTFSN